MDKIQFVQGMYPEDIHFNGLQDAVEKTDRRLARYIGGVGIVTGFALSIDGEVATISPGLGFDALGRVLFREESLSLDLSSISRPSAGQYKWISFYVAFARNSYGDVYDDNNQRHDLYQDEDVAAGFIEGAAGTEGGAVRPPVGDNILVVDILIDSASSLDSFTPSTTRRESIVSAVTLKNRMVVVRVAIDEAAAKVVTFSDLGLPDGSYSVLAQIVGSNNALLRSLAAETTETDITLRLYHDGFPYDGPVLGAPGLKAGAAVIGDFIVGDRDSIPVDLFIRKEDL